METKIDKVLSEVKAIRLEMTRICDRLDKMENRVEALEKSSKENDKIGGEYLQIKSDVQKLSEDPGFWENMQRFERRKNIIIFGIEESAGSQVTDEKSSISCLSSLVPKENLRNITCKRIGNSNQANPRLLLVTLPSVALKKQILSLRNKLGPNYRIRPDLTIKQRESKRQILNHQVSQVQDQSQVTTRTLRSKQNNK